jgi:hypothetical protein
VIVVKFAALPRDRCEVAALGTSTASFTQGVRGSAPARQAPDFNDQMRAKAGRMADWQGFDH